MDHHAGFADNAPGIMAEEERLIACSDLVVVTSQWLQQEIERQDRPVAVIRNATEFAHFNRPPARVFSDPEGRRVIGYYGAIAQWFDVALVRAVAERFREQLVLLVGSDTAGVATALADLRNVRFIGEVKYTELPYWLHGFDVCLLPFKVEPLTLATNPVKIYEYLSAGKPVVAVDLPEMAQFGELVHVAGSREGFVEAVGAALQCRGEASGQARAGFAARQTWGHRADELDAALASLRLAPVSVIVVTYNNLAFTRQCLDSLERCSDWAELEIIVVDNASHDGTPDFLRSWAAGAASRRLILNPDNRGFAAANNQGLAAAGGDYLILLNNDTHVTAGWVRGLVDHLRRDASIGLVGPVTNNIGNEARIETDYQDMAAMTAFAAHHTAANVGRAFELSTLAFFCVAMPRSTYRRVGALDEAFGLGFFEDDDYCRRVQQAGLRCVCAEDVFVHHQLSASFDAIKAEHRQALFQRNKQIYEAKWGAWRPHTYR
jgi:GT2 family glycosyltransferase